MKKNLLIILVLFGLPTASFSQFFPSGGYQNGLYGMGGDETAQDHGFMLEANVFLEGPFAVSNMNTNLNADGLIPFSQPFDNPPWNYTGTESVGSIPNGDIVDWLLVELRDATDALSAIPATIVETQAVFLKRDGSMASMDGTTFPIFNASISDQMYVVIWHRNHLGIMTANPPIESGWVYSYDFTTAATQVYGSDSQKDLGGGIYGMIAGDADANGIIEDADKTFVWSIEAGEADYLNGDFDLDGQIDNPDKNEIWLDNLGKECQVPD